uniref:Apple domain-containing protein n=1 Tax=Meloidogyne incognita TaxID=6306 RepID=A0A914KR11_MELIC
MYYNYYYYSSLTLLITVFIQRAKTTTEWFGDARAHMNPPQQPPFYDIVYDESDCPFGLESHAIPEYVYFGEMIGAKPVREHSLCLQFCLETTKCKAVNYFESIGGKKDQKTGFCELLVETQYDNPRLMRPFRKATYYEKIKCRTSVEGEEATDEGQQPFEFNSSKGKDLLLLQQTSFPSSVERRLLMTGGGGGIKNENIGKLMTIINNNEENNSNKKSGERNNKINKNNLKESSEKMIGKFS